MNALDRVLEFQDVILRHLVAAREGTDVLWADDDESAAAAEAGHVG